MREIPISTNLWRSCGRYFVHKGRNIFYVDSASQKAQTIADKNIKPTLVLVHGFPTSSWDWTFLWHQLSRDYRLIALDLLGFGFSDKPKDITYSILDQTDLVESFVKICENTNNVHGVVVHDYGVSIGQELLARSRTNSTFKFKGMCILNGGLFPETHRAKLIQKLLNSPLGFIISRFNSKKIMQSALASVFAESTQPSKEEHDAYWALISEKDGHRLSHKLIKYINDRKANRDRWVAALVESSVPVRLINGLKDPISGAHMVARYRELIPASKWDIVELPSISHYPQVESPNEVADAIDVFMKKL